MKFNSKGHTCRQAGFTLIELLLYMLIFPTIILALSSVFGSIVDAKLESESYSSVDLDGRYILAKLIYDFQSADSADSENNYIAIPGQGATGDTLTIGINSVAHTYSLLNGDLKLVDNLVPYVLNSINTTVSDLSFQRIGTGTNKDTVRVSFRLTSKINRHSGADFRDFHTTLSMP